MKNKVHKYALLHCLVKTFCYFSRNSQPIGAMPLNIPQIHRPAKRSVTQQNQYLDPGSLTAQSKIKVHTCINCTSEHIYLPYKTERLKGFKSKHHHQH